MATEYGSGRRSYPKWSLNGNKSDINAIGGGVSEYFGAGGSSPLSGSLEEDSRNVHRGPLRDRSTSRAITQLRQLKRIDILLHKLWAASILRDNMVTVFGYILNYPDSPLDTDMYTSLYRIYDSLRYRRLPTAELVPYLREMSSVSPTEQFKILFEPMKKICPKYLVSSVQVWIVSLEKNTTNIDAIVRPHGGPLLVDFLAGIEPTVLKTLEMTVKFDPTTIAATPPYIIDMVGPLVGHTLSSLTDGSLSLTQPLFALILLHRPMNYLSPEWVETLRFLIDVLRLNHVQHWQEILKISERSRTLDPFTYGKDILIQMADHEGLDKPLRDAASRVVSFVTKPKSTYSNVYYDYTSQLMSKPTIDVLLMLKAIHKYEYAEDVVEAKNNLQYYILSGYVDTEYLIKGFNRFDHAKPINILIAILTRAELRLSKLPEVIMSTIRYLRVNLIFKKFLCSMFPNIPQTFLNVPFLVDSFSSKDMPSKIRAIVDKLSQLLPYEDIPSEELLKDTPLEECSKPRMCIMNLYRRIIKKGYLKGRPALEYMKDLIENINMEGNPISDHTASEENLSARNSKKCIKKVIPKKCRRKTFKYVHPMLVLTTTPAPDRTHSGSPNDDDKKIGKFNKLQGQDINPDLSGPTPEIVSDRDRAGSTDRKEPELLFSDVHASSSYLSMEFTTSLTQAKEETHIMFPVLNSTEEGEPPDHKHPESLIPPTELFSLTDIKLRPLRAFLSQPNLYKILGKKFRSHLYKTKGKLIREILKRSLAIEYIRYDTNLFNTIRQYLVFLEFSPSNPELIYDPVFPEITPEFEHEPANPKEPIKLLPEVPPGTDEFEKLDPLRRFFRDVNLYVYLGPDFQPKLYSDTKGALVRAILYRAVNVASVKENYILLLTIKQYLKHLEDSQMNILSMSSVSFPPRNLAHDHEPANWKHIETLLPPTKPGSPEHLKLRPLRLFLSQPNLIIILGKDFHPENYTTKGKLLRALLQHCLTLKSIHLDRQLIQLMTDYLQFLESDTGSSSSATIGVNSQTIIKALPLPSNAIEEQMMSIIQQFLAKPMFQKQVLKQNIDIDSYRTRGEVLKDLLGKALQTETVSSNISIKTAFSFYQERVYMEGYGAQSVDYVIMQQKTRSFQFDAFNIFRAIDNANLDAKGKAAVRRVIDFVSYNFKPSVYLNNFDFKQYNNKSEFLKAAFKTFLSQATVSANVKSDITFLMPHILDTGPGAEPIDYEPPEQLTER